MQGLQVIELAGIGPGPFACLMLADLGADVVRVDRAGAPRAFAGWHRILDRGRRSVALDLKQPSGVEVLLRLVAAADVLVEGFRPGTVERLGVGPDTCLERNPGLIYARMTGWGQAGPLARSAGHDINYLAITGALDVIGPPGGAPVPPANLVGDFGGGGMLACAGILAALIERQRSGAGQVIDAAIVDGTALLLSMLTAMGDGGQWRGERGSNLLDGGAPFYTVYPCADGRYVAVGALEEPFYDALLAGLGLDRARVPDREDRAQWPALREALAARFLTLTRDQWAERFAGTDACVSPVLSLAEAPTHPQHQARKVFQTTTGGVEPAPAPRFTRTVPQRRRSAPLPGADTREVLAECGYPAGDIDQLVAAGTVGTSDG